MQITWTNCADKMPPYNSDVVIHKFTYSSVVHKDAGEFLSDKTLQYGTREYKEWTPYSKEKWEELNK